MKKKAVFLWLTLLSGCAYLSNGTYTVSFPQADVRGISAGHYGKITVDQRPGPLSTVNIRLGLRNASPGILRTNPQTDRLFLRSKTGAEFPVDLQNLSGNTYTALSVPAGAYISYDLKVSDKLLAAMILNNELKEMEWRIGEEGVLIMKAYYPEKYAVV